jgi:1,4-alpha-glucan branching enzyme
MTAAQETILTPDDLYLFNQGTHYRLYDKLGAHILKQGSPDTTHFAVWAPNARKVSLIGDFNGWQTATHQLKPLRESGIWTGIFTGIGQGSLYKFHITSRYDNYEVNKTDPFASLYETPPKTASVVWDLDYSWGDRTWMADRQDRNKLDAPISIYEVHLGSWRRVPEQGYRSLTYREIAPLLADYVRETGFTHIELLPVMEHPFFGSWGYQTTGYFAPTSRYGTPQDFMYLVDYLHQHDIGVILDWVPSHFPSDIFSLAYFDGTHLYEHADPKKGIHPDWNSCIFNYGRHEVVSFLISSALFWLDKYHADGLRFDAVASMLYNDYSRKDGEWVPNQHGGRENLEALAFLRRLNEEVYRSYPGVQTIAEESTAWPMVSRPTYLGGLGFGLKWDMGWMHDTLEYMQNDPIHRKYHHSKLTFRQLYSGFENFVLPLSHDEVVHGKGSLLSKMPGDDWQKLANLRLLLGYMYGQNGKKLLFMGSEFGQWQEWDHDNSLDWHLLDSDRHIRIKKWVADLNHAYRSDPPLYELDCEAGGFEWIDCNDSSQSIVGFIRKPASGNSLVLAVCNFTPVPRLGYRLGVPRGGFWKEILNSDALDYGGSGMGNLGGVQASPETWRDRPATLSLTLPPLAIVFFKSEE